MANKYTTVLPLEDMYAAPRADSQILRATRDGAAIVMLSVPGGSSHLSRYAEMFALAGHLRRALENCRVTLASVSQHTAKPSDVLAAMAMADTVLHRISVLEGRSPSKAPAHE